MNDYSSTTTTNNSNINNKLIVNEIGDKTIKNIKTSGLLSTIFNLTNGLIGTGTLSYGYAFYCLGLINGLMITLIFTILTILTLYILVEASMNGQIRSYQECVDKYLGKTLKYVCEFAIILYTTGVLSTILVVCGQFIKPILDSYIFHDDVFLWNNEKAIDVFFAFVLIYPLLLFREIKFLALTSFVAVNAVWFLSFFVIINGIISLINGTNKLSISNIEVWVQTKVYYGFYPYIFLGISIVIFGYNTAQILFPTIYEMKKSYSMKHNLIVILVSVFLFSVVFTLTGVFGFISFGANIEDNILLNFKGSNLFANLARLGMSICCTFSYPVMSFSSTLAIASLLGKKLKDLNTLSYLTVQTCYFAFNLIIALFIPKMTCLLSLSGAVGASILMFLLPSFIVLKVQVVKYHRWRFVFFCLSIFLFIIFLFCLITGLIASVFRIIEVFS